MVLPIYGLRRRRWRGSLATAPIPIPHARIAWWCVVGIVSAGLVVTATEASPGESAQWTSPRTGYTVTWRDPWRLAKTSSGRVEADTFRTPGTDPLMFTAYDPYADAAPCVTAWLSPLAKTAAFSQVTLIPANLGTVIHGHTPSWAQGIVTYDWRNDEWIHRVECWTL